MTNNSESENTTIINNNFLDDCPLVVDLDGTLIYTDMLHESVLKVMRDEPLCMMKAPFWLCRGKAILKENLASRYEFDPKILPYNKELICWLEAEKASGRKLILCTATNKKIAESIAEHLRIFDEVIASDENLNVAGKSKALILKENFGLHGFDYVGNSSVDLYVWEHARKAIVVNASPKVESAALNTCEVNKVLPKKVLGVRPYVRMLRVHQWLKNLLIFIPIVAAHEILDAASWELLLLAFISFSFCASSVYIANDLLDLESDRLHPRKRKRPFASGDLPIWLGALIAPALLLISIGFGIQSGKPFMLWLSIYFVLTCAYSWGLKRIILIDCVTLALLYTLRIIAGAAAIGHTLSFWLLAFSVFLFLSLAYIKRYAELEVSILSGNDKKIHGRGYRTTDAPLIQTMGVVAGYVSVLILALYINSDAVLKLYQSPELIWGSVPVMLFWISWMWIQAHRGKMHDDPLVFAVKDRASLVAGVAFFVVMLAGTFGVPSW